jgi:hypothetical protein
MSRNTFVAKVKGFIQDRAWQFVIGSSIALIAGIVIPTVFFLLRDKPEDRQPKQLSIQLKNYKKLTDFPNTVAGRTKILIDGKEQKDVELVVYSFYYVGDGPVRPIDFEQPIRVTVAPNKRIIAAQRSLDDVLSKPYRIDENDQLKSPDQPQINVDVTVLEDYKAAEIRPVLLNPEDWFVVEIYTASYISTDKISEPEATGSKKEGVAALDWSCRVAGVRCGSEHITALAEGPTPYFSEPLGAAISQEGWAVYFIVAYTILNLGLILALGRKLVDQAGCIVQFLIFALAVCLSMTSAGVLAEVFFQSASIGNYPRGIEIIFWGNYLGIVVLIILAFQRSRKQTDSAASAE